MYENLFQWFVYVDVFLIGAIFRYTNLQVINDNNRLLDKINDKDNIEEEYNQLKIKNDQSNQMISKLNQTILDKNEEIVKLKKENEILQTNERKTLPFRELSFGNGLIRVFKDGVYYHGVCEEETQKWNKDNKCSRYIYEYQNKDKQRRDLDKFKTYNIDDFCNNCLLIGGNSRKKKIFQCQGHEY
uniref:Uncharacterized protein n=1 Tax=viral metagenome TaxID=1070528 RepID=A0A6C0L3W4_9ZZZZ|tara:strand:- start:6855 stop:7412 length:558 start_codon:yes stop_codon:yes gene_type:complete